MNKIYWRIKIFVHIKRGETVYYIRELWEIHARVACQPRSLKIDMI